MSPTERPARPRVCLRGSIGVAMALASLGAGCRAVPATGPDAFATEYAEALEEPSGERLYALLSDESKKRYDQGAIKSLLAMGRPELVEVSGALRRGDFVAEAEVRVGHPDGDYTALAIEDGAYRIVAAEALPSENKSVPMALAELRRVLSRRSYSGLLRLLTPTSRALVDEEMRSLVKALDSASTLDFEVQGDRARANLPEGHVVHLRRIDGVWRIDNFD